MFTMAKIRDGSTYLAKHLSANDYYAEKETVRGQWVGRGAGRLGLQGDIGTGDAAFEALRSNRHPSTGEQLTCRDREDRICFYDFQCSAPKSVSVMGVTLGDGRLLAAHDEAVTRAFAELEAFAATQANTVFQRVNRITGNVVAGAFRHTASRALDPQVHTHLVTANATWDESSKSWRALTEFEMLHAIRYAGKVYQNELAGSCRRLGYELDEVRDERGRVTGFEIRGVQPEVRERFSKRRAEVEQGVAEFTAKYGRSPSVAEIHAITLSTRNCKLTEITTPEVLAKQRAQLSGEEWADLLAVKGKAEGRSQGSAYVQERLPCERESLRAAVGHIYERKSVASGHEVLAEALNQNLGYVELPRLKKVADKVGLVQLGDRPGVHGLFSTERGLRLERWAIQHINESRNLFGPLARDGGRFGGGLSEEQRRALEAILACPDQVQSLRGAAGVGKTTLVKALDMALRTEGKSIVYCAPTTSAADTLRQNGISGATTVSDFLANRSVRDADRLHGAVLVVDEAGLAANKAGAELLRIAERHHARVVFIGDSRQHTSVEAGDFLRVMEAHSQMHCVELLDIRRQIAGDYRAAVRQMAAGAARSGLESLDAMGAIKEGQAGYLADAVATYLEKSEGGKRHDAVIAVMPTWAENRTFTAMLRTELTRLGQLGSAETVTVLEPQPWTRVQKERAANYEAGMVVRINRTAAGFKRGAELTVAAVDGRVVKVTDGLRERVLPLGRLDMEVAHPRRLEIAVGDKLLVRANDRAKWLINGEVVDVAKIDHGVVTTLDGRKIDTGRFRLLDHGFAVTSHKSQSKTADHVVVAAERLDAKAAYVACSRGRLSCSLHTPDKASLFDRLPSGDRTAAMDVLADGIPPKVRQSMLGRADLMAQLPEHQSEQELQVRQWWGWWRERFGRWLGHGERDTEQSELTQPYQR
jgi:conjugative relaxase-like TrwC/TraI family protein